MPRPPRPGMKRTLADAVEAAEAGSDRSVHYVSITALCHLIGRDKKTIRGWIDNRDCPVVKEGGGGKASLLDPAAVFEWRERYVRDEEAARFSAPDDDDGSPRTKMTIAELNKLEDIRIKRQTIALKAKILVHRDPLQMAIRQANGLGRQTIMSIPAGIVRKLAGSVTRDKLLEIQQMTWDACCAGLTSWETEVSAAMKAEAERVLDFEDIEFSLEDADGEED